MDCPSPWANVAGTSMVSHSVAQCSVGVDRFHLPAHASFSGCQQEHGCAPTWLWLQVPPALKLAAGGVLLAEGTNKPAVLRGINWFGWSVGSFNFDGLWAYCDDNSTSSDPPCQQDGDIPPWLFPSAAIGGPAQKRLGFSFW